MCENENLAKLICKSNGYEFKNYVGSGAFKETYEILKDGSQYALKIFNRRNSNLRTERELKCMQEIDSSNCAKLFYVNSIENEGIRFQYSVEEFLSDGTLTERVQKNLLTKNQIFQLSTDILSALSAMYKYKLVHRDIKPENIMFRGEDAILVDFGLVRDLREDSLTQTHLAQGPGTAYFAPPEQLNNRKELIDWRSDQFSLGVTLTSAFLGVHPYEGDNPSDTVNNVITCQLPNVNVMDNLRANKLDYIVKMIQPYPIQRFRTLDLIKNAIEEAKL